MYSLVDTCVALHNSAHSLVYIDVCFLCTRINTCSNVHTSTYMLMYYHTHKNTKKQRQIHQLLSFCRHTHYTNCLPYVQIIPVAKQCFAMFVQWLVFDLVFILCCKTYWSITWQNRILVGFTDSCSIDINEVGFHVLILLKELSIMDSFLFVNSYHFHWGANMQSIVCVCNCIGNGYAEGGTISCSIFLTDVMDHKACIETGTDIWKSQCAFETLLLQILQSQSLRFCNSQALQPQIWLVHQTLCAFSLQEGQGI